jgi:hypothetical protein
MALLKRSTLHRLSGEGANWLQTLPTSQPKIVNRVDFILEHCSNKKVLHIGFTDHPYTLERLRSGTLLHSRLKALTTQLAGVDIEAEAIKQYSVITKDENVFRADITIQYPPEVIDYKPQLVLLSEVLEHLTDPYKAIEILHQSFAAGTTVLVTVPNYTAMDSLAASLNKTESIHPQHHWYFSPYTLCRLLDEKKFKLTQLNFGMYYQPNARINPVLKAFPFNGDCIIALFTIIKNEAND